MLIFVKKKKKKQRPLNLPDHMVRPLKAIAQFEYLLMAHQKELYRIISY